MLFNTSAAPNWTETTDLILEDEKYEQTKLEIVDAYFNENKYSMTFVTNNPLNLDPSSIPFTRRLLLSGSIGTNFKVNLRMDQ